ncbi:hypothetical protein PRIPAC_90026 [Pristionchus pacificus]|uniref:Uncharacterized protein n=1 Tax=Pristionchus pacificus TaxID=54126 RepID=A0A2A6CZ73_PRIPA|nr:hypothetical protein PRIPAC_90026 [Pristionchus pacificus]|eukprot:PDM83459.1 hypothetical protein PRIPAC_35091 [Pristionchus pacificus]
MTIRLMNAARTVPPIAGAPTSINWNGWKQRMHAEPPDNSLFKDTGTTDEKNTSGPEDFMVPLYYMLGIVSLVINAFSIYLVKRKSSRFSDRFMVIMMATTLMVLSSFIILLFNREQALLKLPSSWKVRQSATPENRQYAMGDGEQELGCERLLCAEARSTTLSSKGKMRYTAKAKNAFTILLQFVIYLLLVSLPILFTFVYCNREDSQYCQLVPEASLACFSIVNAIVFIIGNKQYKKILVKRLFNIAVVNVMNSVTDSMVKANVDSTV